MTVEQVIASRGAELFRTGMSEAKVQASLKKEFNIKGKIVTESIKAAKIIMFAAQQEKEMENMKENEVKPTEEEKIVSTEVSNTSEETVASDEIPEGACEVFGQQDTGDPACIECSKDFPVAYAACATKKPKPKKKVVAEGEKKERGGTKRKGAGFEKVKFIEGLISEGTFTQKEVFAQAKEQYPDIADITLKTYISDSKNSKYFAKHGFSKLTVVVDGKLCHL